MNDELKMKILEFWLDKPDKIGEIPEKLKKEVIEEDIDKFYMEIGEINPSTLFKHLEKIRNKLLKKQTFELQKNSIETQKTHTKIIIIFTVISVVLTGVNVSIAYFNYKNTIEYQKPYTIPAAAYCPDDFVSQLTYRFEVRNIGKSTGIISNITIENKSSTYTIKPRDKSILVPPQESVIFDLIMFPKTDIKNLDFSIIIFTERGCFKKTCNYKWISNRHLYEKINEDTWYGC